MYLMLTWLYGIKVLRFIWHFLLPRYLLAPTNLSFNWDFLFITRLLRLYLLCLRSGIYYVDISAEKALSGPILLNSSLSPTNPLTFVF